MTQEQTWSGDVARLGLATLTAPLAVYVATPALIIEGLRLFGADWAPVVYDTTYKHVELGLYADVASAAAVPSIQYDSRPLHRPVIYWGTGVGVDGLKRRKGYETSVATARDRLSPKRSNDGSWPHLSSSDNRRSLLA
jgi:hypothetical protein